MDLRGSKYLAKRYYKTSLSNFTKVFYFLLSVSLITSTFITLVTPTLNYKKLCTPSLYINSVNSRSLVLIEPKNNTTYPIGVVLVFNWTSVENATSYILYIDVTLAFNSVSLIKISNLNTTHYTIDTNTLEANQVYYWKVCALLYGGEIISSGINTFEITKRDNMLIGNIWFSLLIVVIMVVIFLIIFKVRSYNSSH